MRGPAFTPAEDLYLTEQAGQMTGSKIAAALGRPKQSIYSRARQLSLSMQCERTFNYWTGPEDKRGVELFQLGATINAVAEALGRSVASVSNRKAYYRAKGLI